MNLRYLSMSQLSEITGLDRRTVRDRLSKIKPYKTEGKAIIFDSQKSLPILFGFDNPEKKDLTKQLLEQELKLETAKTEKLELEIKKIRGEYVPIEDVCRTVEKEYTYVRSTLLSIPSKRAMAFSIENDPATVQKMLAEDINEALNHLQAPDTYSQNRDISSEEVQEEE